MTGPETVPASAQQELENWCRSIGSDRALSGKWERGAQGSLGNRVAALYLNKVKEIWARSKNSPGRQAHIWYLLHSEKAVEHVALESLVYVLGALDREKSFNAIAAQLGKRAEMILFLTHPCWGRSQHLRGLKLASGGSLDMDAMLNRLKDGGFRKAAHYRKLESVERIALGGVFIECICEATRMVEIFMEVRPKRKRRMLRYTQLYWDFLGRWKEALALFRPVKLPMLCEPRPWEGFTGGGYLSLGGNVSKVDWARWPEVAKYMHPCVLASINHLQSIAHEWDHHQVDFAQTMWHREHEMGSLPSRTRLPEPVDSEFKEKGLGPSAYWRAVWAMKADRRKDGARSSFVHAVIGYRRLQLAEELRWVWSMDHRGRLYQQGTPLSTQGTDHYRTMFRFQERSPIHGHELLLGQHISSAYGIRGDNKRKRDYFLSMAEVYKRVGEDPLDCLSMIESAKEPFRFVQLCRDWAGYCRDSKHTTGTIFWIDQTCSGWGHVACLTGDKNLALYTNVIGHEPADLYEGIGLLVESRVAWKVRHTEDDRLRTCLKWWHGHNIPRSLWKRTLMPVIYGRSYMSLSEILVVYCRDELSDFLNEDGVRIVDLARAMASVITEVVNEALPNIRDLARWLSAVASIQIDKGQRPYWYTPNGMAVESWASETKQDRIELHLAGRKITCSNRVPDGFKPDKRKTARKLVPDFIHSQDAAFLQRFVAHWKNFKHPINTVHDCFGTTLEHVETMNAELCDQWARFYSVDYLERHRQMVAEVCGVDVPAPPMVGTLDRSSIGENSYLFS